MYEVNKNTVKVAYEDAGGITNTAHEGETQLGTDYFDGTELADTDEVLSRRLVCDRCGYPIKKKSELIKQAGWMVCHRCLDE